MFNKLFAAILSVCMLLACGLFLTACDGLTDDDTGSVSGSEASDTAGGDTSGGTSDTGSDSGSGEKPADFDSLKSEMLKSVEDNWRQLLIFYPDLAKSEYAEKYNEFVADAENAKTTEELNELGEKYMSVFEEIQANLTIDMTAYKAYATEYMNGEWNKRLEQYVELHSNEEFTSRYNEILSRVNGAAEKKDVDDEFSNLYVLFNEISGYYSASTVEGTIQICLPEIESRMNDLRRDYDDKITEETANRINAWYERFYGSATVEEVYDNQRGFIAFLDELIASFGGQSGGSEIEPKKAELRNLLSEKRRELSDAYPGIDFSEEINAKEAALYQKIEEMKTVSDYKEIYSEVEEYFTLAEKELLNGYVASIKKAMDELWEQYKESAPAYETLKNQYLYVLGLCDTRIEAKDYYFYCFRGFESVLQNAEYDTSWNSGYVELTAFYISLYNEQIIEAARKKAGISDDLTNYIKSSETLSEADERFGIIKNAIEPLKDMTYVVQAETNGKNCFEVKTGTNSSVLIKQIISEVHVKLHFSDGTIKDLPLTSDMVDVKNVDFKNAGTYEASILLKDGEFEDYSHVIVCVAPDMENAKALGEYRSTGNLSNDHNRGGEFSVTLYDNGYVKFDKKYYGYGYFSYTNKGKYLEIEFDRQYEFDIGLFVIDEKAKTIDYYRPEGSPIVELDGLQVNLPGYISVFGEYTVAGQYVAICNYGQLFGDAGYSFGWPTYCTLDMENKKFSMNWIKTEEKGETYTWDDGESPYLLRYDIDELKEQTKEKIKAEWNALVEKGYDLSYWENMYGGCDNYVFQVEIATSKGQINEVYTTFENTVKQIKSNKIRDVKGDFTGMVFYKGDDFEEFIEENFVGKNLTATLEYGDIILDITVTRDMITYAGNPEAAGEYFEIFFKIECVTELYGSGTYAFSVDVMPKI